MAKYIKVVSCSDCVNMRGTSPRYIPYGDKPRSMFYCGVDTQVRGVVSYVVQPPPTWCPLPDLPETEAQE